MLAQRYPGYEERGAAMGQALAGLAFGVLSKYLCLGTSFHYDLEL